MENNTTVGDCVADCVEAASSSIFDDIEMVLVAGLGFQEVQNNDGGWRNNL